MFPNVLIATVSPPWVSLLAKPCLKPVSVANKSRLCTKVNGQFLAIDHSPSIFKFGVLSFSSSLSWCWATNSPTPLNDELCSATVVAVDGTCITNQTNVASGPDYSTVGLGGCVAEDVNTVYYKTTRGL